MEAFATGTLSNGSSMTLTAGSCPTICPSVVDFVTTPFYGYNSTPTPLYLGVATTDMEETSDAFVHYIVLPGVKKSDVNTYVRNSQLHIEVDSEDMRFKSFASPQPIDIDDDIHGPITLTLSDGILTITIKKVTPDIKLTIK